MTADVTAAVPDLRHAAPALAVAIDETALPADVPAALWDRALTGPLVDYLRRPGKELRGRLAAIAWQLAGGRGPIPAAIPLAIEALHAGSLIVDDVQDDAAVRRGGPALHVVAGVPLAINTGNWLYFWALEQLAGIDVDPRAGCAMHRLAVKTLLDCHQGQALDLAVRVFDLEAARVPAVVAAVTRGKSAALMAMAAQLPAIAAGAAPAVIEALGGLGAGLGTGLQMLDDLGGLAKARRAKGLEDLRGGRATWPWAWLAEKGDQLAYARLQHRARAATDDAELEHVAELLYAEVESVGRGRARAALAGALARAHDGDSDHPALVGLAADVHLLESSYG